MDKFIESVIQVANERNIPLSTICKETGIATTSFQNWKNGSQPTIDKAIKIIKYLDLSADEVFGIKKDDKLMPAEKSQFISIGRKQLRHVKKVINLINDESSRTEVMKYLEGLDEYADREIEKYNEWDKHTME